MRDKERWRPLALVGDPIHNPTKFLPKRLHNEENYDGLYDLLDTQARQAVSKDEFVAAAKQTFEKLGKVQSVSLSQAKVYPSPLQARMIYNVKFEKGDGQ